MFTMSSHAAMILWPEVAMHVSCLGLVLIVLRSNPQVLETPEKAITWDS
jgi:hypothetical protein